MVSAGLMPDDDDQTVVLEGDAATARPPPASRSSPRAAPSTRRASRSPSSTSHKRHDHRPARRIGVIGSGVAGLTAAYVASRTAHVTLFEADERLGGHADTHGV